MIEFEIGGRKFRADKLDAIKQFHVSRKIAPLVPALIPVFLEVARKKGGFTDSIQAIADLLQPFANKLSDLSEESAEYVINACLSVVRIKHGESFVPLWSAQNKVILFDDMNDMGTILPIVVRIIQENLGPFIQGLLTSQSATLGSAASA